MASVLGGVDLQTHPFGLVPVQIDGHLDVCGAGILDQGPGLVDIQVDRSQIAGLLTETGELGHGPGAQMVTGKGYLPGKGELAAPPVVLHGDGFGEGTHPSEDQTPSVGGFHGLRRIVILPQVP